MSSHLERVKRERSGLQGIQKYSEEQKKRRNRAPPYGVLGVKVDLIKPKRGRQQCVCVFVCVCVCVRACELNLAICIELPYLGFLVSYESICLSVRASIAWMGDAKKKIGIDVVISNYE